MSDWIEEGKKAPAFTLAADDGTKVKLADLKGTPVVLYFYPKDDTPGCTKEACAFRDRQDEIAALGAKVFGVSPDTVESHVKFRDKFELNLPGGAFYSILKAPDKIKETKFVEKANSNNVLIIPGNVFSEKDTHFRISYATSDDKIQKGIEILCKLA